MNSAAAAAAAMIAESADATGACFFLASPFCVLADGNYAKSHLDPVAAGLGKTKKGAETAQERDRPSVGRDLFSLSGL
jgi:hypothetical protein